MAVYQISKIQIRRGKASSGVEFPQLASGEMGWAIDTQELFIGNGSVSEGAPSVGNTKIITSHDELLTTADYSYKITIPGTVTGVSANAPVYRPLQSRLDDRVNLFNYGAVGDGMHDDTDAINRALAHLFASTDTSSASRVILEIPAGTYYVTKTISVPSYATIVGTGIDKTFISYSGAGIAIQCITDNNSELTLATQPKNIKISDLTILTDSLVSTCIDLSDVRNSEFYNIQVKAALTGTLDTQIGILFNADVNGSVTDNIFKNIYIDQFYYGISNNQYAFSNTFDGVTISHAEYGVVFGINANSNQNQFNNFKFNTVAKVIMNIASGTQNRVSDCYISTMTTTSPQIYFADRGNECISLTSNRSDQMSSGLIARYYPEVAGHYSYTSNTFTVELLHHNGLSTPLFRLPLNTTILGQASDSVVYTIHYNYVSTSLDINRYGTLSVIASTTAVSITDDYTGLGTALSNWNKYLDLEFSASIVNYTIVISSTNNLAADSGNFTFYYTAVS